MQVNNVNSPNFTKLHNGGTLVRKLSKTNPGSPFYERCNSIKEGIISRGLHEKQNVDVFLNYSEKEGFIGVVNNPECVTPEHSLYKLRINNEKSLDRFSKIVDVWDKIFLHMQNGHLRKVEKSLNELNKV